MTIETDAAGGRPVGSRIRLAGRVLGMNLAVEGEVRAPVVVVCGQLRGDVHATERVELAANARVQGNIYYKVVEMAAGAMLTGRLIHADAPLAQLTGPEAADPVAA